MRHTKRSAQRAAGLLAPLAVPAMVLAGCGVGGATGAEDGSSPAAGTTTSTPRQSSSPTSGPSPVASQTSAGTATPTSTASSTAGSGQQSPEQVRLGFRVDVEGATGNTRTFYGAAMPVSKDRADSTERIPKLWPGAGYTSVRLTDNDRQGRYTGHFSVPPGRYLVTIFTGLGVTGKGYPERAADLISQSSIVFRDAVVQVRDDRAVEAEYQGKQPGRACGDVGFAKNSDSGAFDVRGAGIPCDVARDVARGVKGRIGEDYTHPAGFNCRTEGARGELPSYPYRCHGGPGKLITFDAS